MVIHIVVFNHVLTNNCYAELKYSTRLKFNSPEISVHDEANDAQADECIFPFVHISYPQNNHR